jgi:catechol 2,3-dioxygenase-like lactoylglutathione lyase family enzyme
MSEPSFRLRSVVLGTPDPRALASFYVSLLGGEVVDDEVGWVVVQLPGGPRLAFQEEVEHVPPVWPAGPADQQIQAHLDIAVDDLATAPVRAVALGARQAAYQPQDDVRVMLDPDGHPFCLFEVS